MCARAWLGAVTQHSCGSYALKTFTTWRHARRQTLASGEHCSTGAGKMQRKHSLVVFRRAHKGRGRSHESSRKQSRRDMLAGSCKSACELLGARVYNGQFASNVWNESKWQDQQDQHIP
eukprot:771790-Pleurochrysis_carterae.AAC.2